ncbi:DUF2752 domain-containing protein [Skermania piniformis]|uniref:DUF2752 domain-containing protein n=1 Tax=Skermania pinensis TaxID=39122 RepID=UPI000B00163E
MTGPVSAAVGGAAVLLVLHVRDPHVSGSYGYCPFRLLTGWWCPGCGGLRAVHDLTDGQLVAALGENALALPALLVAAVVWVRHVRAIWRDDQTPIRAPSTDLVLAVSALCVAFAVFRNTPWGQWLAPS